MPLPRAREHTYTGRSTTAGRTAVSSGGASIGVGGSSPVSSQGGRGGTVASAFGGSKEPGAGGAAISGGDTGAGEAGAPTTPPPDPPPLFSKAALLEAVAECSVAEIQGFLAQAELLVDKARAHAAAPSDAGARQAARDAFLVAMDSFQVLEVFRFGPAARVADDPAGKDLRDQMYAWPLGGRCNIETQIVSEGYSSATFSTSLINLRGMGALEFLLFYEGNDNTCPDYSPINVQGTWLALGEAGLRQRKALYAQAVAENVLENARELSRAWQASGGDYRQQLIGAGVGQSQLYATTQAALNAVSNALFYVEVEDKDLKLGVPLALSPDCLAASCPEALESRYARSSARNIANNLRGFQRLFWGCGATGSTSLGFDDWLRAVAADNLESRMSSAFQGAAVAIDGIDRPLEDLLLSEPTRVRGLYDAIKVLTDLLKSEFVSVLELELPKSTEGDND
ncbi:MAG: imelysin family protein [Polyangiaceae bacterium]